MKVAVIGAGGVGAWVAKSLLNVAVVVASTLVKRHGRCRCWGPCVGLVLETGHVLGAVVASWSRRLVRHRAAGNGSGRLGLS